MDVRLFSVASFRNGNIATLIIGLGEFGIVAVLPLWLQFTLGYSALNPGSRSSPSRRAACSPAAPASGWCQSSARSAWSASAWPWRRPDSPGSR